MLTRILAAIVLAPPFLYAVWQGGWWFFLLALFEERARGYERYHIADPFGGPRAGYESCYRRIDRAVSNLVKAVQEASRR